MKIAVFHNFLDNIGGAEVVSLTLARELDADIYTTNIDTEKISSMGFDDVLPRLFSLGKIPKKAPFRHQIAFFKFRYLNLGKKYDFYIISGDWAMSGAVNHHPNMWYVHGPLNELWQFKDYVRESMINWFKKPIFDVWVWLNRKLTLGYSKSIDVWVCNSKNTQGRINKFYNKIAEIIYPPIETRRYYYSEPKNYWLSVNRYIAHKRLEIQMEAFKKLPNEKLIIVASYEKDASQFESYKEKIEKMKPDNVEILSWVDSKKLIDLFANSKGFVATAMDEDFGMTVVEAMASGKPVVASNDGGYKESVINGETGILIDDINSNKLISAIEKMSDELKGNPNKYKDACLERAKEFDVKDFVIKIKKGFVV